MSIVSVKVVLRVRQDNEERECLKVIDNTVHLENEQPFHFDLIYPIHVTLKEIFKSSVAPLLNRFVEGENAIVFGHIESRKLYSLDEQGIMDQFAYSLFDKLYNHEVYVSYVAVHENYFENLFHNESKDDSEEKQVYSAQNLIDTLNRAKKDDYFSQPHLILSISLKQRKSPTDSDLVSQFHFVDLARSEYQKPQSELVRKQKMIDRVRNERQFKQERKVQLIDTDQIISCLTLSDRFDITTYQNSKLSMLLKDKIKGTCQATVLVSVDSSESSYKETLSTLRHVSRLYEQQDETEKLRAQVSQLRMQVSLLSNVHNNHDMENQIETFKKEMEAIRSYTRTLTDELVQIKSEKETMLVQGTKENIQTHPIIKDYVSQVQQLKLQVAQTQMKLDASLQRPTSLANQISSSSSLLNYRFSSTSSLDMRRSTSKSISSGRRPMKRRYGSRPKVVYSPLHKPRKSQPNLSENIDEFINILQKEYEKSTDESILDDNLELSFENFSFPSITDQPPKEEIMSPNNIQPSNSYSENILLNEDKLEALAVPAWSDELKNNMAKRTSISVESMWDDTDSSITTSCNKAPAVSTSYKNDRKQNRKLLKMLHQSQADFLVKRELVGQLEKTEDLYRKMRLSYEKKLDELKNYLLEIQKQRDVALKKKPRSPVVSPPGSELPQSVLKLRENKQAQGLRSEYEVKLKHLIAENQELRKKNAQLTQASNAARVKADSVICQLQQDIEALTIQKKQLNRKLKLEVDHAKEASVVFEREIHQLKRRETSALDTKNKLEEENEAKNKLIKKRSEETTAANAQLRQLTNALRKAANAGTFLNEANLEKLLNSSPVAKITKRRSTIGTANPPNLNLQKDN